MTGAGNWQVECRTCGWTGAPGLYSNGCPACLERGTVQAVTVRPPAQPNPSPATGASRGIWSQWGNWLPDVSVKHRRTLGEGNSPLLRVDWLSKPTGCSEVYLKMEATNPTGAHKDRFHAVTTAVAASLGMRGTFSASTGNHGLSMTVYAQLHGLESVVLSNPRMPMLLQRAIRFAGGIPFMSNANLSAEIAADLLATGEWLPASTLWPMPIANPYGVEGYKTIAWEIAAELAQRPPAWILVPTAGADLLTGLWLGYEDLQRMGTVASPPHLCACQPDGAAPLVRALRSGAKTIERLDRAYSVALSIADPITGQTALDAIAVTDGDAVSVSDEEILAMGALLARHGLLVEPSSAASVASLTHLAQRHPEMRDQPVVCVITSSALKWLDDYGRAAESSGIPIDSLSEAWTVIEASR
jgi:threonine synthase